MLLLLASGRTGRGVLVEREEDGLWRFAQVAWSLEGDDIDTNTCIAFFNSQ